MIYVIEYAKESRCRKESYTVVVNVEGEEDPITKANAIVQAEMAETGQSVSSFGARVTFSGSCAILYEYVDTDTKTTIKRITGE